LAKKQQKELLVAICCHRFTTALLNLYSVWCSLNIIFYCWTCL